MSDTPRTDEYYNDDENPTYRGFISVEFAHQLEKELAEARADMKLAKNILEIHVERIAKRDKLIEQMRVSLRISLKYVEAHAVRTKDKHVISDAEQVKAALSAAERGE